MTDITSQAVAQLREAVEVERLRCEHAELTRLANGLELSSRVVLESAAWGDLVDRNEAMNDWPDPADNRVGSQQPNIRGDRTGGMDRPVIQTEMDLAEYRGLSRWLCYDHPGASAILNSLTNYVVGSGWSFEVADAEGVNSDGRLKRSVQAHLDELLEQSDFIGDLDREIFRYAFRDGEALPVLQCEDGLVPWIHLEEPSDITEPGNTRALEDWLGTGHLVQCWKFGVHTEGRKTSRPLGFHVVRDSSGHDWDYIPDTLCEFYKSITDRNVTRGLPELYIARNILERVARGLKNTQEGATLQAAIVGVRKHASGTLNSDIQSLPGGLTTFTRTGNTGGSQTVKRQKYGAGTVLDAGGYDWVNGPMGATQSPIFLEVIGAALRLIGAVWSAPEWIVSGDASNNNMASSLVAESPFVKTCEAKQAWYVRRHRRLIWKALGVMAERGAFRQFGVSSVSDLQARLTLDITPSPVQSRDAEKETARRSTLYQAGLISPDTWAAEEGYDLETETAKGAKVQGAFEIIPEVGKTATSVAGGDAASDKAVAGSEQDIQVAPDLVLNGAQITAAVDIVTKVALGEMPRDAGLGQLTVLFNLTASQAEEIMGTAGTATPTTPNPKPSPALQGAITGAMESAETSDEIRALLTTLRETYP